MAVLNPPGWLQNAGSTHTAEQMRNFVRIPTDILSSGLLPKSGVNFSTGAKLKVTQTGSPSMDVIVGSGHAVVAGTESTKQGGYGVINDADFNITITTAHATLNRIDIIVFKVEDSQYSGSNNTSSLVVVTGTAASSPVAPTAPNNSITLAQIFVGAGVTSISNANITDTRRFVPLGIFPVTNASDLPSAALAGRYRDNLTTGQLERDSGSAWVVVGPITPPVPVNVQVFTSTGTWTKPANAKSVKARVQASGGAGGGSVAPGAGAHSKGGGGGAGGYSEWIGAASGLAATVAITIGAAGTGVSGAAGNNGATASFGAHAVSAGGTGGSSSVSSGATFSAQGGAGGTSSAGTLQASGGGGANGTGGGQLGAGGNGGGGMLGGGAKGTITTAVNQEVTGFTAGNYGGGGGGSASSDGGLARAGGAGGPGVIIVETWF